MNIELGLQERDRLVVVRQIMAGDLRHKEAAERLGVCERKLRRLVRRWRLEGDGSVVSRRCGKAASNALCWAIRARLETILLEKYLDFSASLAAEKLASLEDLHVSRETVRQVQIKLDLHKPKARKARRAFQSRERRPRFGELIQIDGSPHAWLEGRCPRCTLIVFIDDATSRLTSLLFTPTESTRAYLLALRAHIKKCMERRWRSISDRRVFRVNAKEAVSGDGLTEFGRVLRRLGIESICAHTPQAKGRVERANQTLQDRLIKEMRLLGISTMEEANAFLPAFLREWNAGAFVKPPQEEADAHRPWTKGDAVLEETLARHEERTLSKNLTFQCGGISYAVKVDGPGTALRGAKVTLIHRLSGEMIVRYKDRSLVVTAFKTRPVPSQTEDEKTIDARMMTLLAKAQDSHHATQPVII
jgi:transposase